MSGSSHIELAFNENQGILGVTKLNDLNIPYEVVEKAKKSVREDFNKKTSKWKVQGLMCILIPIGFPMFIVGIVNSSRPFGFPLIAAGILLVISFPVYLCVMAKRRENLIKKFQKKIDEKTQGVLRVESQYATRRIKTKNGHRNQRYLKCFKFVIDNRMLKRYKESQNVIFLNIFRK